VEAGNAWCTEAPTTHNAAVAHGAGGYDSLDDQVDEEAAPGFIRR
jgi:hypothetical protein